MAANLPGALLRDLGADVTRLQDPARLSLDAGVEYARVWNRGKEVVEAEGERALEMARRLARDADVVLLSGAEAEIEGSGLGARELLRSNPRAVVVRVRPSFNALGPMPDLELLVAARAGLPTQIRGHEPGRPVFPSLAVGQAGAAFSATAGALAGLYDREATGLGGWAETSLYDGLQAMLPMIIGQVEHHSPSTRLLWHDQGPGESLCYQCSDGGYVQLWFGAKGAYEEFLAHIGDPPSESGYNSELMSGAMEERGRRWAARFATRDRAYWLEDLAGHNFRCEPVLRPGEALLDPHLAEVGLSVGDRDLEMGPLTVLGPPVRVTPAGQAGPVPVRRSGPLLSGVRVLDLSAYLAGPVAALVLAELGADVVKVEPVTGDVHRNMEPMFAAGQRGKRAVALDLKSPDAPAVLEKLFGWADVVHHNSRVGLSERLGYDEARVRAANPNAVYSFSSGFGEQGPKALLPANDQLIQALSGIEESQAGAGSPPTFLVWGAVDVAGGWMAACGILAGLYARRRSGEGQRVRSSLLGAGLTLKSGAFVAGGEVMTGPVLDPGQHGYGAAYRIYEGGDGSWFALAVPDAAAWQALRAVTPGADLPADPPPLRCIGGDLQPEEESLQKAFLGAPAGEWVASLRSAGVPAEMVSQPDRTAFSSGFVDDPVNRQMGRIVTYRWGDRGRVAQPCFPPRMGPTPRPGAGAYLSGLGEHTAEVLEEAGLDSAERGRLAGSGAIPPDPGT